MANIQLTGLDFNDIKQNLKTYLKGQNIVKDADYEGSVLSILLDILSLNTHYNAYYLNMVANEMFLDTASKRSSVVSIAKMLGYTPKSTRSCSALLTITIKGLQVDHITLPRYTKFISLESGESYTFVTITDNTVAVNQGTAVFENIQIIEGEPVSPDTNGITKIYEGIDTIASFTLPDKLIDLSTLKVFVQKTSTEGALEIYNKKEDFQFLDGNSAVYFVEEASNGFYYVYFGDGVIGKALENGNVVYFQYIISSGKDAIGMKDFRLASPIEELYTSIEVKTITAAFGGDNKESTESIKFSAPKYYSTQNRAVSHNDYITAIQNNSYNFTFDSVNVWGGQDNDPPVYGKVFISAKPKGSYTLTLPQKEIIKTKIIKPISVVTVEPEIVDPDYVYIQLDIKYFYDKNKTFFNEQRLSLIIKDIVYNFASTTLNTFNSTFNLPELMYRINNSNPSIITNECKVFVQKKFTPAESVSNYVLDFGSELEKGVLSTNITSYPAFSLRNPSNYAEIIEEVFLEEVPLSFSGISEIKVTKQGSGYVESPIVKIEGDGKNAKAHAVIINGKLSQIIIDDAGYGYSEAKIILEGYPNNASAIAKIESGIGTIRAYYYSAGVKTLMKRLKNQEYEIIDYGSIDYKKGKINLKNFNPVTVKNTFGELTITAKPVSDIIYSSGSKLITIDPFYNDSIEIKGIMK